jgi:hypothetical protein
VYHLNSKKCNQQNNYKDGAWRAISEESALPSSAKEMKLTKSGQFSLVTVYRSAASPEISKAHMAVFHATHESLV